MQHIKLYLELWLKFSVSTILYVQTNSFIYTKNVFFRWVTLIANIYLLYTQKYIYRVYDLIQNKTGNDLETYWTIEIKNYYLYNVIIEAMVYYEKTKRKT